MVAAEALKTESQQQSSDDPWVKLAPVLTQIDEVVNRIEREHLRPAPSEPSHSGLEP